MCRLLMHRFSDPAGSDDGSRKAPPTMLPSAEPQHVGTPSLPISRLNSPACAHPGTNASLRPHGSPTHGQGHRDSLDLRCRTLSFPSLMPVVRRFRGFRLSSASGMAPDSNSAPGPPGRRRAKRAPTLVESVTREIPGAGVADRSPGCQAHQWHRPSSQRSIGRHRGCATSDAKWVEAIVTEIPPPRRATERIRDSTAVNASLPRNHPTARRRKLAVAQTERTERRSVSEATAASNRLHR